MGKIYAQSVAIAWSSRVIERNQAARDLEQQNADLERSIAALTSRERIVRDAGERLGMVVPSEDDLLWIPVLDRGGPPPSEASPPATTRDPRRLVGDWLDALWQEDALALTSQ